MLDFQLMYSAGLLIYSIFVLLWVLILRDRVQDAEIRNELSVMVNTTNLIMWIGYLVLLLTGKFQ